MMELTKCVFYHNYKTGGDWVKNALGKACTVIKEENVHCNRGHYANDSKQSFAFVRHPVSVFESVYHYYRERKDLKFLSNYTQWVFPLYVHLPFDQYVKKMTEEQPGWLSNLTNLFLNGINFVGRQENLQRDLLNILDAIGEPYDREIIEKEPRSNAGSYRKYKRLMTPELKALIEKSEAEMIHIFYNGDPCKEK